MKLRIRVRKQTSRLDLEEQKPTLGDLRSKLSTCVLPSLGYSDETDFSITLNGKDALTDDQNTLESSGIISGDLIVVVLPESQVPLTASQPAVHQALDKRDSPAPPDASIHCSSSASKRPKSQEEECKETNKLTQVGVSDPPIEQVSPSEEDIVMEEPMSGPLWELMLCSEAEDGQIPHSLEMLYRNAACTNAGDALMVAIHLLMLETGYFPLGAEAKVLTMPEDWRSASAYKLHYTHPLCAGGSATLACVPMGKFIVVNGNLKINDKVNGVKKLQLSTDTYILFPEKDNDAASVYKDLRKLSRIVKDQLVYPLLATTRQVLNLPDFFGLLVLPLELKVRIFRLLDVHSLVYLSATCKELLAEIEDPLLWRFLCIRDFRVSVQRSQETDWKSLYKKKHKQKLEALHLRRMLLIPYPTSSLPFHPTPYYPGPFPSNQSYPPGIIGGRYDQRPILPIVGDPNVSLIPGVGPISGRFFPFTPHLDPSRPFSEPNPMCPGPRSLRPSRGRGPDVRRDFI